MSKLSKVITALFLVCALTLSGCASLIPDVAEAEPITVQDLTVSIPVYFEDMSVYQDSLPASGFFMYGYSEIVLTGLRDDKTLFEEVPTLEEYAKILKACIAVLPPETVVHRITGDGAKKDLVAPAWSADKKRVLNYLNHYLK